MGSEQSVPPKKQPQRAPPVRRGHTIATSSFPGILIFVAIINNNLFILFTYLLKLNNYLFY